MKSQGHTIVLVEQNFRFASKLTDRHYVMERGRVIDMIPRADVQKRASQIQQYLGI
jgi:branched-chain amino acid transport system ATP-binding protein